MCWNVKLLVTGSSSKLKVKTEAKLSSGAPLIPNIFFKSNEQKVCKSLYIQVSSLTISCNMSRCYKLVLTQILSLPLDLTETRRRSMRTMSRSSSATFMESWCRRAGPRWPGSLKTVMGAA